MSIPKLVHRLSIRADVSEWVTVGEHEHQELVFVPIMGGSVTGDIEGEVLPGGGDWARFADDDVVYVEARYLFRTTTGAVVDVVNTGIARYRDHTRDAMDYFATRPVFRASDPDLAWLNRSVFVGSAVSTSKATTIEVYEVVTHTSAWARG